MKCAYQSTCCAVLAIAIILLPSAARAQFGENPFEPAQVDRGADVFGPSEPTPKPISVIDPAPADDIPLPAVADTRAAADQSFCRCIGEGSSSSSVARIRQALDSPLKPAGLDFVDQRLEEVASLIQEEYGVPVKLDTVALDDIGVASDEPISVNIHGISLRAALRLMLRQKGLVYAIQNEVLLITTPDEAEVNLKTCVYDVRGLVEKPQMPMGASAWAEYNPLIGAITECVAKGSWSEDGSGTGTIRSLGPGFLVVSQTGAVHDEIRELIATLREFRRTPPAEAIYAPAANAVEAATVPKTDGDSDIVTRCYYLQFNQQPGGESLAPKIRELIMQALPDEGWAGRLDNNEPVVLTVLPDRVVLRHRQSVQKKVLSLLVDSGLTLPPSDVSGRRGFGGGGGFGGGESGGGGGFFNPQP